MLLKWLGERGTDLPEQLRAAAAVSVPFDLERGSRHIEHGFARVYTWHFLRSLKRKAHAKLLRYPGAFDAGALESAENLYEFDDAVTAPVHGFENASDYYGKSSSIGFLAGIRTPTLLISALDDPFLPREVGDAVALVASVNSFLVAEFTERGGHVGFVSGYDLLSPQFYAEERAVEFLANQIC